MPLVSAAFTTSKVELPAQLSLGTEVGIHLAATLERRYLHERDEKN